MAVSPFHLAWFLQGSSIQAWGERWTGNISSEWMYPELFLELARAMERACMDYLLIEDSIYVGQNWKNSREIFLKTGMSVPRQEPSVVAALMAGATKHLGIVPTLSTFAYHPYLTARIIGTLDQVSSGRAGYNMVTGSSDLSAQNFGMDRLPDHDLRYDMAEEYIQICKRLWGSWEPNAIVANRACIGRFLDLDTATCRFFISRFTYPRQRANFDLTHFPKCASTNHNTPPARRGGLISSVRTDC